MKHWVKGSTEPDAGTYRSPVTQFYHQSDQTLNSLSTEYPFAKYNIPSQVLTYSQDEYTRLLEGTWFLIPCASQGLTLSDSAWTKEETDYLFDLVREYDMRFFVIADRYEYPGGEPRTIEVRCCTQLALMRLTGVGYQRQVL